MENEYILIVDDEARMRKLIKDFLKQKGYVTLEAADGEEALQIFAENKNKIRGVLKSNIMRVSFPDDTWEIRKKEFEQYLDKIL